MVAKFHFKKWQIFASCSLLMVALFPSAPTYAADEQFQVTGVVITAGANPGDVVVNWVEPVDQTGLTGYFVQLYEDGGQVDLSAYVPVPSGQNSWPFDYQPDAQNIVTIGKKYFASVQSQYSNNYYAAVSANPFTVYGSPGAPTGVTAMRAGEGAINLTWVQPVSDGGSPITAYEITCFPIACPEESDLVLDGSELATSQSLTGLEPITTYSFIVTARNAKYTSDNSLPSNGVKPFAQPGQPGTVVATPGIESVKVTWTKGALSSSVTRYFVEIVNANGLNEVVATGEVTGSVTTATVIELQSGIEYKARVTPFIGSVNGVAQITPSNFVPEAATVAHQPRTPSAIPADRSATVSWAAPISNGGRAITGYLVTSSPGNKTCTSIRTSCKVSGLINGTSYIFKVKATNSVGSSLESVATKAVSPFSVIGGIKWAAKSKGKSVKATFKPIAGATTYSYVITGATKKTGSCSIKGKGSKATVNCDLTLVKGKSTVVVSARTKAKTDLAKATKALSAS